jgi:hypothetical protein
MKRRQTIAAMLATLVMVSCSTTATITRWDGPDVEATIESSDAHALYVRGGNGQIYRLDRRQVGPIDHPGNVALTVGASLAALAAVTMAAVPARQDWNSRAALGLMYGLPAVGLIGSGGYFYLRSTSAAREFDRAAGPAEAIVPLAPLGADWKATPSWAGPPAAPHPSLPPAVVPAGPPPETRPAPDGGSE